MEQAEDDEEDAAEAAEIEADEQVEAADNDRAEEGDEVEDISGEKEAPYEQDKPATANGSAEEKVEADANDELPIEDSDSIDASNTSSNSAEEPMEVELLGSSYARPPRRTDEAVVRMRELANEEEVGENARYPEDDGEEDAEDYAEDDVEDEVKDELEDERQSQSADAEELFTPPRFVTMMADALAGSSK